MITLLMTTFEAGRIAQGHDMVIADTDGKEYNVRGPKLSPEAQRNSRNLRQVSLGCDQFRTVVTGGTAFGFLDGGPADDYLIQVAVRLPSLAEYRAALVRAKRWFDDNGLTHPGMPDDEQILPLITPVEI